MVSTIPDHVRTRFAPIVQVMSSTAGESTWNMSLDQAILESVDRAVRSTGRASPVIRFYTWQRPTLSLGYFQSHLDASPQFEAVDCVRRATGGGAILHHHELTYSMAVPVHTRDTGSRQWLYRNCHAAIAEAFDELAIHVKPYRLTGRTAGDESSFLCFQRRTDEDLICNGYKIVGSAQRRAKDAVLQHGSILMAASDQAPELPGVLELSNRNVNKESLSQLLAGKFSRMLGLESESAQPSESLRKRAGVINCERFSSPEWWRRR